MDRDYFARADETLKHPDGRAKGGEPCVQCGQPVPADAAWKLRDRHVCSSRCNANLMRKFKRGTAVSAERAAAAAVKVAPIPNPRLSPEPRLFRTVPDQPIPVEWEGYGPLPGDVAERWGVNTFYGDQTVDLRFYRGVARVAWTESGNALYTGTTDDGFVSRLILGTTVDGIFTDGPPERTFVENGVLCRWRRERIIDLHFDGARHFEWETWVAAPLDAPAYRDPMHSPRYRAEMDRRARIQAAVSGAKYRAIEDAIIEEFDPHDVFERDGWFCQVCGTEVDRTLRHPHLWAPSLDHRVPLAAGGDHTPENTQLAHLGCNIAKGDTFL